MSKRGSDGSFGPCFTMLVDSNSAQQNRRQGKAQGYQLSYCYRLSRPLALKKGSCRVSDGQWPSIMNIVIFAIGQYERTSIKG